MADAPAVPARGPEHHALEAWIGGWRAEGTNYAANGTTSPWRSDESVEWLPGKFFALQRWNEHGSKEPFIGLGVIGVDPATKRYVLRSFENHGFYRHYDMTVDGDVWTISGETERARVAFTDGGGTQLIRWEFKPGEKWQPLCERTARRKR